MEFMQLNARGVIITIPFDIALQSGVLTTFINGPWKDNKEPFYLNYSSKTVHLLLDALNGEKIKDYTPIEKLMNFLSIKMETPYFIKICDRGTKKISLMPYNIAI